MIEGADDTLMFEATEKDVGQFEPNPPANKTCRDKTVFLVLKLSGGRDNSGGDNAKFAWVNTVRDYDLFDRKIAKPFATNKGRREDEYEN